MLVYIAAALTALFYLFHVPVRAVGDVALGPGCRVRLGVGIFGRAHILTLDKRLTLEWVLARAQEKRSAPRAKASRAKGSRAKAARGAVSFFAGRVQMKKLEVRLGTGDACLTALSCGGVQVLLSFLWRGAVVRPLFSADSARFDAICIMDVLLGHIIVAALWGALSISMERVRAWISGRLRAL